MLRALLSAEDTAAEASLVSIFAPEAGFKVNLTNWVGAARGFAS